MTYEELLLNADEENLIVKEKNIEGYSGRIYKNRIAIHHKIPTTIEKSCILAEELGHYYTTSGNILDQSDTANRKQEFKARLWAYNKQIGLMGLIRAFESGCRTWDETADYLQVSEEFLHEAVECYRSKYGVYVEIDNYLVYFIPVYNVLKIID